MGFFNKRPAPASPRKEAPPLGSGRRLSSQLTVEGSLEVLEGILASYRTPKYRHLPHYDHPGWAWSGDEAARFATAVCCDDSNDDFLFIGLRSTGAGTEFGIFPLGSGDDRLTLPIIGEWKQRDPSLSSIGLYPAGVVRLKAPVITTDLYESTLRAGGYPVTPANVDAIGAQMHVMFLAKASEYIGSREPQSQVHRFIDSHPWQAETAASQSVLDDLVAWNAAVTPYIQGLPMRVRAILLEKIEPGTVWDRLES